MISLHLPQRQLLIVTLGKVGTNGLRGGGDPDAPPIAPRLASAKNHTHTTARAPCANTIFTGPTTCTQGLPNLAKGSRASGSADEVLVIALAALTYDKRCGGKDEYGHSLEDVMVAVENVSTGYVEDNAWIPPEVWRRGDQWIAAYLKEI